MWVSMNNRWVSVKDKLPPKEEAGKSFLCQVERTVSKEMIVVEWFFDGEDEYYFLLPYVSYPREVTYWMYLPAEANSKMCGYCDIPFTYDWHHDYDTCPECGNDTPLNNV